MLGELERVSQGRGGEEKRQVYQGYYRAGKESWAIGIGVRAAAVTL